MVELCDVLAREKKCGKERIIQTNERCPEIRFKYNTQSGWKRLFLLGHCVQVSQSNTMYIQRRSNVDPAGLCRCWIDADRCLSSVRNSQECHWHQRPIAIQSTTTKWRPGHNRHRKHASFPPDDSRRALISYSRTHCLSCGKWTHDKHKIHVCGLYTPRFVSFVRYIFLINVVIHYSVAVTWSTSSLTLRSENQTADSIQIRQSCQMSVTCFLPAFNKKKRNEMKSHFIT